MIYLPHLLSISKATVWFLRSVKLLIFPTTWIRAYLRMSEDRGRISWSMESLESSTVLVELRRFAITEKILSYKLHHLMMRDAPLKKLNCFTFYFPSSCLLLLSATMRHQAPFTAATKIPEEGYGFNLHPSSSTGVLLIPVLGLQRFWKICKC